MEIVTAPVSSISEIIFNRLFDAAGRQIGYLLNYNDNIKALQKQAHELKATRDSIQVIIDAAARNREIILPNVQSWISEVDNVFAEAETLLEDEGNANKMCFRGWCINLRLFYRFSKQAKQKIAKITQLQEHGKFQTLSQPAPPPAGIISPTVGFSGIFKSRESIKNEIMEALKDDKVSIVGICGLGGVGKTTLVKQVGILAKEQKLFDSIVMVVVSQTPNIMNIQREIAHILDLKSLSDCPSSLWERIKGEKRILIILDDIWRRIQLEEIGIPFGKDHGGCKIVLTSRRKNVCDQMGCDKTFTVGTLTKQESWSLFKELVGMDAENSIISSIAREVTAECDGLPIAIVTVARALKNRECMSGVMPYNNLKVQHQQTLKECMKVAQTQPYILSENAGTSLKEWPKKDTFKDLMCISLMLNDIKEVLDAIECPMLQSLLLQRNSTLVVPNNFFQGMKNLGVLDLSETQLSPLPESLSFLVNLRTLYLNGCKLGDLSIIGDLSKLDILSLYGSNVREIPISFRQLTHMRLLDLNNCKKLTRITLGVISSLCKLEELYVLKSFRLWDLEGDGGDSRSNAKLAELQFLRKLEDNNCCIYNCSFVSEHIETLEEIAMVYRKLALVSGIQNW
ncbi:probable disease resistance protein At1g61190 [Mangifera indica]|uniref:probable disease resistance protein At1g61190 n=1 Tax=Mangifera indica TaxID=29780 RepID=UPI001CFA1023|nr:probable disease resistance protein At1g61190 [Mangifera indica]